MVYCNTRYKLLSYLQIPVVRTTAGRERETEGEGDLFTMEIHRKSDLKRENLVLKDELWQLKCPIISLFS